MKETVTAVVRRSCELCNSETAVCCPSDSAFLCWSCDGKVHGANFLVARHIRFVVCPKCNSVTGNRVSGFGVVPVAGYCPSCCSSPPVEADPGGDVVSSSSSSSACVSSTHSSAGIRKMGDQFGSRRNELSGEVTFPSAVGKGQTRSAVTSKVDPAAEGIFVNWCKRLGICGEGKVVRKACDAFRLCTALKSVLPFRVILAASLCFGLRRSCSQSSASTWRSVKKLEEISGVPAKLILAAESKLQRLDKADKQRRQWMEEGWDEC